MFNPLVNFLTFAHCEVCSERLTHAADSCTLTNIQKKRIYLQHFWSRWATFDPFLFLLRTCLMSQTCKVFPRLFHSGKHAILKPVSQLISGFILIAFSVLVLIFDGVTPTWEPWLFFAIGPLKLLISFKHQVEVPVWIYSGFILRVFQHGGNLLSVSLDSSKCD